MIVSFLVVLILSALIPNGRVDLEIIIPEEPETTLFPIVIGSISKSNDYEIPNGLCVANDGTIFVVAAHPLWRIIHGSSPGSFIAWRGDGSVLWAQRFTSFDRVLYDVETYDTHLFVVGCRGGYFHLAKYDMTGNQLWNVTRSMANNSYGVEWGRKLALLSDGTIIASGISMNYADSTSTYFVAAFNQEGEILWHVSFLSDPSPCCDSDFIYLVDENMVQKRNNSGLTIWAKEWSDSIQTDSQLTFHFIQMDILYIAQNQEVILSTSLNVSTWNLNTGQGLWSRNIRLCDTTRQVYNSSGIEFTVAQDGSMMILMGITGGARWYLLHINQNGELASYLNHLNVTMLDVQFETDDTGLVYIAAVSAAGNLSIFIFDTNDFVPFSTSSSTTNTQNATIGNFEMTDLQLIGTIFVGVVIFDTALILYLKRKVAR